MTTERTPIRTIALEDMIIKRHPAPGWMTMFEVANGTGYKVSRHADAVSLGIWPSHGYELHGFEIKRSRGDVQKELSDPSKADAIGKYVDYWWLVVGDLKIIDSISIPPTWGILFPKAQVLRVHRKAPKRAAKPVDRAFAAAMIRNVADLFVPRHVHEEMKKNALDEARKELEQDQKWKKDGDALALQEATQAIKSFENHSGVSITNLFGGEIRPVSTWQLQQIGEAVKVVVAAREETGRSLAQADPVKLVEQELATTERAIMNHEQAIANRKASATRLRELIARLRPEGAVQLPLLGED